MEIKETFLGLFFCGNLLERSETVRKWRIATIAVLFLLVIFIESCAGVMNGFSDGELHVLTASSKDLVAECKLNILNLKGDDNDVKINLYTGKITEHFYGRENSHNRSARYSFEKVTECRIFINNNSFLGSQYSLRMNPNEIYRVKGAITFRWKADRGAVSAGFPRYYYRTVFSELRSISTGNDDSQETSIDQEPDIIGVYGRVYHWEEWDRKRIKAGRREELFWAGEEFLLQANVKSKDQPNKISVSILGTNFNTELLESRGVWKGGLWDEEMLDLWQGKKGLELEFLFCVFIENHKYTDTVKVIIDDTSWFKLHRKE